MPQGMELGDATRPVINKDSQPLYFLAFRLPRFNALRVGSCMAPTSFSYSASPT